MLSERKRVLIVLLGTLTIGLFAFQNCGQFVPLSEEVASLSVDNAGNRLYLHKSSSTFEVHEFPRGSTNSRSAKIILTVDDDVDYKAGQLRCEVGQYDETSCGDYVTSTTEVNGYTQIVLIIPNLEEDWIDLDIWDDQHWDVWFWTQWIVDVSPPSVSIAANFAMNTDANDALFTIGTSDESAVEKIECRIDGGEWTACLGGKVSFPNLATGSHTLEVIATDELQQSSLPKRSTFTVMAPGPNLFDFLEKPALTSDSSNATFRFEIGANISDVKCSLDAQAPVACSSGLTAPGLALGAHSLSVSALSAGTISKSLSYAWKIAGAPAFENFVTDLQIQYPGSSNYKLVLNEKNADFYVWEVWALDSYGVPETDTTLTPEYSFYASSGMQNRFYKYCVTAANNLGRAKVCGSLTISNFHVVNGVAKYRNTDLNPQPNVANFKPVGVSFATDGAYIFSSYSQRVPAVGEVRSLGAYHVANGNQVHFYETLAALPNASPSNFKVISTDGFEPYSESVLATSGANVYFGDQLVPNVSAATLDYGPKMDSDTFFLKDADTVVAITDWSPYTFAEISGADPATFSYFDRCYYRDSKKIYYSCATPILSVAANGSALKRLDREWVQDDMNIFYKGVLVPNFPAPGILQNSFVLAGGKVAYQGTVIDGVFSDDYKSFSNANGVILLGSAGAVRSYDPTTKLSTVVAGADAATFSSIGSYTMYYKDADQIWYVGPLGLNSPLVTDLGLDPATENPNSIAVQILKTNSGIYLRATKQTAVQNPATFARATSPTLFANSGSFYTDSQGAYSLDALGSSLKALGVPSTGFEIVGSFGYFAKNCTVNKVFYQDKLIAGADCATFRTNTSTIARDATTCWVQQSNWGAITPTSPCAGIP